MPTESFPCAATVSGECDAGELEHAIRESSIGPTCSVRAPVGDPPMIELAFDAPLSAAEDDTLAALIAGHTGSNPELHPIP